MSLITWSSLIGAHDENRTREFVHRVVTSIDAADIAPSLKILIDSIPHEDAVNVNVKLELLKSIMMSSPQSILFKISPDKCLIRWLCSIAHDTVNATPSVRGTSIAILTLLLRHYRPVCCDIEEIGRAVCVCIESSCQLLASNSAEDILFSPGSILLHQCATILEAVGDPSLPCIKLVVESIASSSAIISCVAGLRLSSAYSRIQTDAVKVFSMVGEIWLLHNKQSCDTDVDIKSFVETPTHIFTLMSQEGGIVHDCLHSGFQCALEVNAAIYDRNQSCGAINANSPNFVRHWVEMVKSGIESTLSSNDAWAMVNEQDSPPIVLEIQRVESLIGLLSALFDFKADADQGQSSVDVSRGFSQSDYDWLVTADMSLLLIQSTIRMLKSRMAAIHSESRALKSVKTVCSDVRKGCIALAHSVYSACPIYVCMDSSSEVCAYHFSGMGVFEIAIDTLGTPLLFGAVYRGIIYINDHCTSSTKGLITTKTAVAITNKMVQHVVGALKKVPRYSVSAASDVLSAIEELADAGCTEMFDADIASHFLAAYEQQPKSTLRQQSSEPNPTQWNLRCTSTAQALLGMSRFYGSDGVKRWDSMILFIINLFNTFSADIILLHEFLGNAVDGLKQSVENTTACIATQRKSIAARVQSKFKTSVPDIISTVLHGLTISLVKCLGVVQESTSNLREQFVSRCCEPLETLGTFICRISRRVLLFEDDCIQLCSELELACKIASVLKLSGECHDAFITEIRKSLREVIRIASSSTFQLGDRYSRILVETSQHELDRLLSMSRT